MDLIKRHGLQSDTSLRAFRWLTSLGARYGRTRIGEAVFRGTLVPLPNRSIDGLATSFVDSHIHADSCCMGAHGATVSFVEQRPTPVLSSALHHLALYSSALHGRPVEQLGSGCASPDPSFLWESGCCQAGFQ